MRCERQRSGGGGDMHEAVATDLVFIISLKRSTQNLQLSTSWPADYPILRSGAACREVPGGDIKPSSETVLLVHSLLDDPSAGRYSCAL
jgi:hypothetical protein